jgi:hypothetical protein
MLEALETHVLILNICAQAVLEHICIQRSKMLSFNAVLPVIPQNILLQEKSGGKMYGSRLV